MEAADVGIQAIGEVNRGRRLAIEGKEKDNEKKKFEIDALRALGRHGSVL